MDLPSSRSHLIRTAARPLAVALGEALEVEINAVPGIALIESSLTYLKQKVVGNHLKKLGISYVRQFLSAGTSVCEIAWINIMPTIAAFAVHHSRMLAQVVDFYLGQGISHWKEIQRAAEGADSDEVLLHFALEAIRRLASKHALVSQLTSGRSEWKLHYLQDGSQRC